MISSTLGSNLSSIDVPIYYSISNISCDDSTTTLNDCTYEYDLVGSGASCDSDKLIVLTCGGARTDAAGCYESIGDEEITLPTTSPTPSPTSYPTPTPTPPPTTTPVCPSFATDYGDGVCQDVLNNNACGWDAG